MIHPCNNLGDVIQGGPEKCERSFAESYQEATSQLQNERLNWKECSQLNTQNNSIYKMREKNAL